jgi:hypothetical protein
MRSFYCFWNERGLNYSQCALVLAAIVRQSYPTNMARAQQLAKMAKPKLAKPAQALELFGCRKAR